MKVYYLLVSAFCAWITPTHSQFFYSHYTPLTQINPYFPQTFLPPLPAPQPVAYSVQSPAPSTSAASVTYNLPPAPTAEFRGFGYRTDYKDGASSTVFYVTGPEAENLRNFKDFPSFARKVQEENPAQARSLASDLTDVNAVPDAEEKIQSILQPSEFQKLFDNALPGIINFYTFPAGTVPLALGRSLGNDTTNATTTTPAPAQEAEAAESVINTKVIINDIDNELKTSSTADTTTVSEATTVSSTTEATTESKVEVSSTTAESTVAETSTEYTSAPVEAKEEKSTEANKEEATTVESTTTV